MFFFQLTYMKLNLSTICFILKHQNKLFIRRTDILFVEEIFFSTNQSNLILWCVCETQNLRILGGGATVNRYSRFSHFNGWGVLLWSQGHSRYEKWILREI